MNISEKLEAALAAIAAARDALSEAIEDPDGGNDAEHDAAIDLLLALNALDAINKASPKGWTIGIRAGNATGTTHVSYHEAATVEEAIEQAKVETRKDWGQEEEEGVDDLHVLCVLVGDVTVEQWDDGWE